MPVRTKMFEFNPLALHITASNKGSFDNGKDSAEYHFKKTAHHRYKKNGKCIDIANDGTIVLFDLVKRMDANSKTMHVWRNLKF